jgi:hypothetical protein
LLKVKTSINFQKNFYLDNVKNIIISERGDSRQKSLFFFPMVMSNQDFCEDISILLSIAQNHRSFCEENFEGRRGAARSTDDGVETYSELSITASNKHHQNYSAEMSFITSPAMINPATPGTKDTLAGGTRSPSFATI